MARRLARHIREQGADADLLGPTPAFAARVRGQYQWQIILRANSEGFEQLLDDLPVHPAGSSTLIR